MKFPKPLIWGSMIGVTVGGAVMLKNQLIGYAEKVPDRYKADGKVCIVTGANSGIGKETVLELARRGAIVYMACRDMKKCHAAREEIVTDSLNKHVYCRECDLADFNSIRRFVDKFKEKETRLDILINNAGIMRCPKMVTKQGIEMQLGVNHMGHFLLTNLLLDTLKDSAPSRIVNLSSLAHRQGKLNFADLNSQKSYDPAQAYNDSKLANILFTRELAEHLQGTGVTVNAVHPGLCRTEIFRYMEYADSISGIIFIKPFLSLFLKSPQQGALSVLHAALEPSLETVSGKYFSNRKQSIIAPAAEDALTAKMLWLTSLKWTGLKNLSKDSDQKQIVQAEAN